MDKNYVILHLHSDLSSCTTSIDSVTKPKQYVDRAKECGMKAMAFSEHGSVMMWVKKKEMIEAAGMKYIHAAEMYITESIENKVKDNWHCLLIAKNYDGVLELNRLSSKSFNREDGHYYYVPRITLDELCNTSDNIIVTTACLANILASGTVSAKKKFLKFLIKNKHRCYLEIQHHIEQRQINYNQYLFRIGKKYNIPLITGTDTHALNQEHLEARSILQKAKNIHFENEDAWDLTFKTYDELVEAYKKQNSLPMDVVLSAIDNTNKLADKIEEFSLDRSYKYPHLWENSEEVFKQKIKEGIIKRGVYKYPNYAEYKDRIKYELQAYRHNQAIDFMLLMEDIISWCRTQDIPVGYGRGSVNGSVIAWLLGITEMDSIKHKLNFDRFMNVDRVSLSDIDTDFPPSRINDVKDYIFSRHGLYCSDIATFNTVADKGAIRDVGRALEIPLSEVNTICDEVDNPDKLEENKVRYPELFKYVELIKGVVVSVGNHPCGVITAPFSIDDKLGLFTTSTDNYPISQVYMKEVDGLNYVKLDCLKLDTIELINETCKLAGIDMVTPDNLDIDDVEVWNSIRDDTTGIFQWEGTTGDKYIKKLMSEENIKKFKEVDENVDRMTLFSIGNSAIRPAGASYRNDLANGIVRKSGSYAIDEFLKPTFGYLVFQCQIIEFLHSYCGFTMGEADVVRRHFAKKTGTDTDIPIIKDGGYLSKERKHYIPGFVETMKEKYGMTHEEAEHTIVAFLKVIEDASEYLFSLNHSQPYSYAGYACGWLRYHYPVEFLVCSLNINKDNAEKTMALTHYAQTRGIRIIAPKFRHSLSNYSCDEEHKNIYKGIGSIKFMSPLVAEELYALKDNQYDSFIDLLIDLKNTNLDARQLDILVKLDFFSEFGEINELFEIVKIFNAYYGKKQLSITKVTIPLEEAKQYCEKCTEKTLKNIDSLGYISAVIAHQKFPKTNLLDKIRYENEFLGYIQLVIPTINEDYYYVQNVAGYSNNTLTLYQIKTGNIITAKNRSKKEVDKDVIIKVPEMIEEFKWKKEGDKWTHTDDKELVIRKLAFVS